MTAPEHATGYVPNPSYSQEDWDEVSDTPELTDGEIAELRPNGEGLPTDLADAFKRLAGRPKSEAKAVPVSLRVPPNVLAAYKAAGAGWQTRMNEALAAALAPKKMKLRWRTKMKAFKRGKKRGRIGMTARKGKAA
ncbi:BrnA antitoxin family protein [Methylobacterium sp. E-041]|uniref:BrnA antitoxin family protein n=1 Tax=Methylobacterium sp. E-041 TaxID=2836573 RepID=UPI001FB96E51|nr:BrnA antitoxin family protein [Methylobacterium sp. E-041]MCJ2107034.1 BrnA antitoxin family protein [Methylobacterium sp. E-041]